MLSNFPALSIFSFRLESRDSIFSSIEIFVMIPRKSMRTKLTFHAHVCSQRSSTPTPSFARTSRQSSPGQYPGTPPHRPPTRRHARSAPLHLRPPLPPLALCGRWTLPSNGPATTSSRKFARCEPAQALSMNSVMVPWING
jgi:hypothetical protein